MRRLIALWTLLCTLCATGGCMPGTAQQLLPKVVAGAQDATQILMLIDSVARPYFSKLPEQEALRKYVGLFDAALTALNVGLRAAQGAEDLTNNDADKAFDEFAVAYGELKTFLGQHGLIRPDGTLGADKPRIVTPDPVLAKK